MHTIESRKRALSINQVQRQHSYISMSSFSSTTLMACGAVLGVTDIVTDGVTDFVTEGRGGGGGGRNGTS